MSDFTTRDGCWEAFIDQKKRADALEAQLAEANARVEALTESQQQIEDWCGAYPYEAMGGIFDEPDMAEVRRLLGDSLLTKLSAHNFRHVLNGIKRIIAPPSPKEDAL